MSFDYPTEQAKVKVEVTLTNADYADEVKLSTSKTVEGSGFVDWTGGKGTKLTATVTTHAVDTLQRHLDNDHRVESYTLS